jgi:hypothetical protein
MAFRTFVRLSAVAPPAQPTASAIDIISRKQAAGSGIAQLRCEFNRALLRAKCRRGSAKEASKVAIEMGLVTEARCGCDLGQ